MSVSVPKGTQMQSSRWSLGVQVLLRLLRVMANRGLFRDRVARLVCWLQTKGPGQHSAMPLPGRPEWLLQRTLLSSRRLHQHNGTRVVGLPSFAQIISTLNRPSLAELDRVLYKLFTLHITRWHSAS